ncbi:hypothetical protein G6O67_004433 [Ophiocordyceps sinensis]|uniref:Uncharacterized protein n=1 Tax=Ophiocordyceps sinensis TaxID=72228 RepID=A0A8H4M071_9HYPO|nr:hypothetical protein G6O67_004433 [Ophiocordyceps sinensis]
MVVRSLPGHTALSSQFSLNQLLESKARASGRIRRLRRTRRLRFRMAFNFKGGRYPTRGCRETARQVG